MVCGAKRIRSHYLPWTTGVTPKLSTIAPSKGLASLSTINAATMRLCRADLPTSAHSSRLEAAPTGKQPIWKSEIRISKPETNPSTKMIKSQNVFTSFEDLNFGLVLDFVFRASNFARGTSSGKVRRNLLC